MWKTNCLHEAVRRAINMSLMWCFSPQGRVWWEFPPFFLQRLTTQVNQLQLQLEGALQNAGGDIAQPRWPPHLFHQGFFSGPELDIMDLVGEDSHSDPGLSTDAIWQRARNPHFAQLVFMHVGGRSKSTPEFAVEPAKTNWAFESWFFEVQPVTVCSYVLFETIFNQSAQDVPFHLSRSFRRFVKFCAMWWTLLWISCHFSFSWTHPVGCHQSSSSGFGSKLCVCDR